MKITAPLTAPDDVAALAAAGADELYCGVMDRGGAPGYFPNARPDAACNLSSFADLERTVSLAGALGLPVFFCANVPQGRAETLLLKDDILRACAAGVSGIIAADPSLLPWLARSAGGRTIVVSTLAATMNCRALDFLAAAGARRVVLDQLLTLDEISRLAAHARQKGLDLEVFAGIVTCANVSGDCPYHQWHPKAFAAPDGSAPNRFAPCKVGLRVDVWEQRDGVFARTGAGQEHAAARSWPPCDLCSLFQLRRSGVAFAKVAGRHLPLERRTRSVSAVKEYLSLLERGALGPGDFMAAGRRLHQRIHGTDCDWQRCFHHEVRSLRKERR